MKYKNHEFEGTYNQVREYLKASIPRDHPENWPGGPWEVVVEKYTPTIEERREAQRVSLKYERITRTNAPINNVQVATSEDRESIQWAAENLSTCEWVMADNTVVELTAAQLQGIIDAYPMRKLAMFATYTTLLKLLAVSEEPETVTWPED